MTPLSLGPVSPGHPISITWTISGKGELVASGNANPSDMESVNRKEIRTFKGKAQEIIRPFSAGGEITLSAESEGLTSRQLIILVENSH